MSEIQKGDLVIRIAGCCADSRRLIGMVHTVEQVDEVGLYHCVRCLRDWETSCITFAPPAEVREQMKSLPIGAVWGAPRSWFKKIEPPADKEKQAEDKRELAELR